MPAAAKRRRFGVASQEGLYAEHIFVAKSSAQIHTIFGRRETGVVANPKAPCRMLVVGAVASPTTIVVSPTDRMVGGATPRDLTVGIADSLSLRD